MLRVPEINKPRRHSVGSTPYPEGFWQKYLLQLKRKQLTIAANKATAARTKYEAQLALKKHNKKIEKRRILREANLRLRYRFPFSFSQE